MAQQVIKPNSTARSSRTRKRGAVPRCDFQPRRRTPPGGRLDEVRPFWTTYLRLDCVGEWHDYALPGWSQPSPIVDDRSPAADYRQDAVSVGFRQAGPSRDDLGQIRVCQIDRSGANCTGLCTAYRADTRLFRGFLRLFESLIDLANDGHSPRGRDVVPRRRAPVLPELLVEFGLANVPDPESRDRGQPIPELSK